MTRAMIAPEKIFWRSSVSPGFRLLNQSVSLVQKWFVRVIPGIYKGEVKS
jgi:hypothetical protein